MRSSIKSSYSTTNWDANMPLLGRDVYDMNSSFTSIDDTGSGLGITSSNPLLMSLNQWTLNREACVVKVRYVAEWQRVTNSSGAEAYKYYHKIFLAQLGRDTTGAMTLAGGAVYGSNTSDSTNWTVSTYTAGYCRLALDGAGGVNLALYNVAGSPTTSATYSQTTYYTLGLEFFY